VRRASCRRRKSGRHSDARVASGFARHRRTAWACQVSSARAVPSETVLTASPICAFGPMRGSLCIRTAFGTPQDLPAFAGVRPAFTVVRFDALLPPLRRGTSLRLSVGLPSRSSPEGSGRLEGERRLVEAAGVGLGSVFRNRPVPAFSPKIAPAQHARSAEHAFHSPKSAPAGRRVLGALRSA
jgi:hypothetical protein